MRKIFRIIFGLLLCGWICTAKADTYTLTDGTSITGDVISYNDDGVTFHTPDDKYTDRIAWTKFSQDTLKAFVKDPKLNVKKPKISELAGPFVEVAPVSHTEAPITIHQVQRLELPPKQSVIGALLTSSLGLILILLIYTANLYAAYEIAVFRARPPAVVIAVAAIAPIVGPIIFLSMSTLIPQGATEQDMQMDTGAPPEASAAHGQPGATPEGQPAVTEGVQVAAPLLPETQSFQRGQFTFNRRFFETKFSGFFSMTRHGADKDMLLIVKTGRVQHIVERISRIAANDVHLEVLAGGARQEIMVPFADIQEIQLKHKNA